LNSKYSNNDYNLKLFCNNATSIDDKYFIFNRLLSDLDIPINNNYPYISFNIIIYRLIRKYIDNPNLSMKKLEDDYNNIVWSNFDLTKDNIELSAKGWVRFIQIQKKILFFLEDSIHITSNLLFNEKIALDEYLFKIDLLLLGVEKHRIIIFSPNLVMFPGMSILSNASIHRFLNFLNEAELFPDEVIEISCSLQNLDRNIFIKKINTKKYNLKKQLDIHNHLLGNNNENPIKCRLCPANKVCLPSFF